MSKRNRPVVPRYVLEVWPTYFDEIRALGDKLEAEGLERIPETKYGIRDGYPTRSPGWGTEPSDSAFGEGDPTGEAAIAKMRDERRSDVVKAINHVMKARNHMRYALSSMIKARPPEELHPTIQRENQAPICVNCAGLALWPDRSVPREGLCQKCWWYKRRHDGRHRPVSKQEAG